MDLNIGDTRLMLDTYRRCGRLPNQAAYILATAYHETGGLMRPIKETVRPGHRNQNPSDDQVARRLQRAWENGQLTGVTTPYWTADSMGRHWFGRGYVQLTHEENYARLGNRIAQDLTTDPNAALDQDNAVRILVYGMMEGLFTGTALSAHIDETRTDYRQARRVVNGLNRAEDIANLARRYEADLIADGY